MAYGASAKGNTFLNFAGIKPDLITAVADKSKGKQDKFMPGSLIPIISPEKLFYENPDSIVVLPWNIISEIKAQLKNYQLVTAIPELKIVDN